MFAKPSFDENGLQVVCEMNGSHADMMMNIYVKRLKAGETYRLLDEQNETAVLLLGGEVDFAWGDKTATGKRANPFERKPYCLHVCKNTAFSVKALADSEILIQQTNNDGTFDPVFYTPETCLYQEFGKGRIHRKLVAECEVDYGDQAFTAVVASDARGDRIGLKPVSVIDRHTALSVDRTSDRTTDVDVYVYRGQKPC